MSYVKFWAHLVWSTKQREPFFETSALRKTVFSHIRSYGRDNGIYVDFINGYTDHVHVLVSLESSQCIADVASMLKGESANWLREQRFVPEYFAWQTDYFAVSVSESMLDRTRQYIKNQEAHHRKQTFAEEHDSLLKQWGFIATLKPGASHASQLWRSGTSS